MATNWIKLRKDIHGDPAILAIAGSLGCSIAEAVGRVARVWIWYDDHCTNGNAPSVTSALLGETIGDKNIVEAMKKARWIFEKKEGLEFPNHERYLSKGAKTRALTAKRVQKLRNARSVTSALPEEEEEEDIDISKEISKRVKNSRPKFDPLTVEFPAELSGEPFRLAWVEWVRHRAEVGATLKQTGVTRQLKQLAAWGASGAIESIESSIRNGWRGLFPPPSQGASTHGRISSRPSEPGSQYDPSATPGWD